MHNEVTLQIGCLNMFTTGVFSKQQACSKSVMLELRRQFRGSGVIWTCIYCDFFSRGPYMLNILPWPIRKRADPGKSKVNSSPSSNKFYSYWTKTVMFLDQIALGEKNCFKCSYKWSYNKYTINIAEDDDTNNYVRVMHKRFTITY